MTVLRIGQSTHEPHRACRGGEGEPLDVRVAPSEPTDLAELRGISREGEAGHVHGRTVDVLVLRQALSRAVDLEQDGVVLLLSQLLGVLHQLVEERRDLSLVEVVVPIMEGFPQVEDTRLLRVMDLLPWDILGVIHGLLSNELDDALIEASGTGVGLQPEDTVGVPL